MLVDQHAAHERILFEELRRRMEEKGVPSQRLLLPQTFDLPPRDAEWVERNLATLQKMGIGIEPFGADASRSTACRLSSTPPIRSSFMRDVIDGLQKREQQQLRPAAGRRHDREDRLPARGESERSAALSRSGETDQRSARLRAAVLLPARPADDDPDFARRAGEEVRAEGVAASVAATTRRAARCSARSHGSTASRLHRSTVCLRQCFAISALIGSVWSRKFSSWRCGISGNHFHRTCRRERVFAGKPKRDVDATLLDLGGIFAAGLESPRLRRRACALVVADLDEEKLLSPFRFENFASSAQRFSQAAEISSALGLSLLVSGK